MKTHTFPRLTKVIMTATLSIGLLTGCASSAFLTKTPVQVAPSTTNYVAKVVTNEIPITLYTTNMQGVTITTTNFQAITQVITNQIVIPAVYYTNLSLSTNVESIVQQTGQTAGALWPPAAWIVTGLLALSHVGLGFYNNKKLSVAKGETQSALQNAKVLGETLVQNVEQVRQAALTIPGYTPAIDEKVMDAVTLLQSATGTKAQIADIVENTTGDTVVPKTA